MKTYSLSADTRAGEKKNNNTLRREGFIPATVYGKNIKSESLKLLLKQFISVYKEAHETGLVELTLKGTIRPVLIHHVQKDPVDGSILHVELHQVDLKEKVKASVPLVFEGQSPAVIQKLGVVLSLLSEIEVEALPSELPDKMIVDVSHLETVDQEIKISDLTVPSGVTVLGDPGVVVAKIGALVSKEAEAQVAQENAEAASQASSEASPEETSGEKPSASSQKTEQPNEPGAPKEETP